MARSIESLFVRYRRRGDAAALGQVFDSAAPEVLRVAMHFARHPAEAEDLLQETFLTAIARADSYEADRPLVPWLIGILRNHARHLHRRRRRRSIALEAAGDKRAHGEPWMDVAWCTAVASAVEALPDPYRQVLVLRLRHDKSPAEIAILLDLPPATVRSQIHRGLERLREQLKAEPRARLTALLPVGAGLSGIRARVLSEASRVAATTAVATATLPLILGGLVMTKKSVLIIGTLLVVLVLGTGVWIVGGPASDDSDGAPGALLESQASEPRGGANLGGGPLLAGSGAAREAAPPSAPQENPTASAWPPKLEIPEDKGSVAGTIRFEDGTPLVGARVALWGSPNVEAETDAEGRYHIHADWVHGRALFLRLGGDGQPDYLGLLLSSEVSMRNGKLVTRDLKLKPGIEVASTVIDGRSGDSIADVKVTLRRQPLSQGQGSSGFGVTDARGRFAFPYVPRGAYTVELKAQGYEARVEAYDLENGDLPAELELFRSRPLVIQFENLPEGAVGTEVAFDLSRMDGSAFSVMTRPKIAEGGSLQVDAPEAGRYRMTLFKSSHLPRLERDIVIPEGPLDTITWALPMGARVEGRLLDVHGSPLANARVSISGAAGRPKTDAQGRFEMTYVPAGKHVLKVQAGTAWICLGQLDLPGGLTTQVELRAPGSATVRGRFQVGGQAVDRYGGELKFFDVATKKIIATTRPDAKGAFEVPLLPAGQFEIRAWASGAMPLSVSLHVRTGETKDIGGINLEPFIRIPVQFLLPSGDPAPKNMAIGVAAHDPAHALPARMPSFVEAGVIKLLISPRVEIDAFGKSWVAGLTRGGHRLELTIAGFEVTTIEVEVKPGMTEPIAIQLVASRDTR